MLKLHVMPAGGWGVPNPSPFCLKVMTYLRMRKLEHQLVETLSLGRSPTKKLPFIDDDGLVISDSPRIIDHCERRYGPSLPPVPPTAHPIRRMLEEGLYFAIVYSRWADDAAWPHTRRLFLAGVPAPLRGLAGRVVRPQILKQLRAQGYGRHDFAHLQQLARDDMDALATFLDSKRYALGDEPSQLDATVFGFVANLTQSTAPGPLGDYARSLPPLRDYAERLRAQYFPST